MLLPQLADDNPMTGTAIRKKIKHLFLALASCFSAFSVHAAWFVPL